MKQTKVILTICFAILIALLSACRDSDDGPLSPDDGQDRDQGDGTWKVLLDIDEPFAKEAAYQSVTATIEGRADQDSIVIVSAASDGWLYILTDTLPKDGIVRLAIAANGDQENRTANITFTSAVNPAHTAKASVSQLSASASDQNGMDARSVLYIGYGYDIYAALDNPMSVRTMEPIIDYAQLVQSIGSGNYQGCYDPVQTVHLARTEISYVMSNTIQAYSQNLTQQQCPNDEGIEGCTIDCDNVGKICMEGDLFNQNIGRCFMTKTVVSRVLDKGALLNFRDVNKIPFTMPMSSGFARLISDLRRRDSKGSLMLTGEARRTKINEILRKYGTHVIIQVDLGGRIDYSFTKSKYATVNYKSDMEEEMNFTLGQISDNERNSLFRDISSDRTASGSISVCGGSQATRRQLEEDILQLKNTDGHGQLPSQHVVEWLASINYSDMPQNDPNLEVVHFELMPIWDIVYEDLRTEFLDAVLQLVQQRSDCQIADNLAGTDIYTIDATREDLFDFSNVGTDQSLCRILYLNDEPVLEVCSEYVPKIRTDRRVTVAYPIYKQRVRINEGIFIGDGVHQPAMVGFSNGECFVLPLSDCATDSILSSITYINGNLATNRKLPRTISEDSRRREVRDDVLPLITTEDHQCHNHPVVKVGSTFWTRHDIRHAMEFTEDPDDYNGDYIDDLFYDNIIFTRFMYGNSPYFTNFNKWIFGYEPNNNFDDKPNTKWYLPQSAQVMDLYAYLGFNPKSLFKGQVSGFEAEFNGYVGASDIRNNGKYFSPYDSHKRRYNGEVNVICSKNSALEKDACLVLLDKDYRMSIVSDGNSEKYWRENYYAVRLCRGYLFKYPTLKEYDKNTKI